MKIDYISDLHTDFWFGENMTIDEYLQSYVYKYVFNNAGGEILLIAGDLGHKNEQNIKFLKIIQEVHKYNHIFCVLGNHDYYIMNEQWSKYEKNSFLRTKELKHLLKNENGISLLDGQVEKYKELRIGGCGMWYDGQYIKHQNPNLIDQDIDIMWKNTMMDALHIGGIKNFRDILDIELKKLDQIFEKSDIILTHVNPSIEVKHTFEKYSKSHLNGFYSFDGTSYLKNTTAKHWIFGHVHTPIQYKVKNIAIRCNPLGYPHQSGNLNPTIRSFRY